MRLGLEDNLEGFLFLCILGKVMIDGGNIDYLMSWGKLWRGLQRLIWKKSIEGLSEF